MVDCNNLKDGRICSEQGPPSDAHSRVADRLGQTHAKNRDGAGHQSGHVDPFRLPFKPSRATAAVTPRRLPTLWLAFSISRPIYTAVSADAPAAALDVFAPLENRTTRGFPQRRHALSFSR